MGYFKEQKSLYLDKVNIQELETVLKTISLTVGYPQNSLFEDLNLELYAGQLVCFMGPNGIGKSSLIRTLAGLQNPLSGKVVANHWAINPKLISVVLTDKITGSNMTAYELVTYGRYPYLDWNVRLSNKDKAIIDRAVAYVHIEHLADRKVDELSDGQLQMVMIARALAQDTPIVLLDEPTAHLDLNNRVEIMKLLRKLSHDLEKAILISTHELDLALQTADMIWLTGKNKNILKGLPEDLVLDGSFDAIFQFKGFDLKTGKIQHESHRQVLVTLHGEGPEFLWTKNALERSGFEVITSEPTNNQNLTEIKITVEEGKPRWILLKNNRQYKSATIADLIEHI
jgi:iron complex transport system ATP-binding protein